MKYAAVLAGVFYLVIATGVFTIHTQMPVTFGLAVVRAVLWPLWFAGLIKGSPLPMD